jgi:hypothetical protein
MKYKGEMKEKADPRPSKKMANNNSLAKDTSGGESARRMRSNPDIGPEVKMGAHHWDKGYMADEDVFDRDESYPDDMQRGNEYVKMNKEIVKRDSTKLKRSPFSKIH